MRRIILLLYSLLLVLELVSCGDGESQELASWVTGSPSREQIFKRAVVGGIFGLGIAVAIILVIYLNNKMREKTLERQKDERGNNVEKCPKCGAVLSSKAKFCQECGADLQQSAPKGERE